MKARVRLLPPRPPQALPSDLNIIFSFAWAPLVATTGFAWWQWQALPGGNGRLCLVAPAL